MKLEEHISQLLYRYQCVTIPGFGAFLTEVKSAQVHQESHAFYPPKKVISFNAYLKNNDGLLANYISLSERISYEVAIAKIENEVFNWKQTLYQKGVLYLKNIGEISLNSEQNLVFEPSEQVNYQTESFGLTSYVSPTIQRKETIYVEEEIPAESIVLTPVQKPIEKQETPSISASNTTNSKATITENVTEKEESDTNAWLKYAALFLLGGGLIYASIYYGNNYYNTKAQQETVAVKNKVKQQVDQKIQEATFAVENPLPTTTLAVDKDAKVTEVETKTETKAKSTTNTKDKPVSTALNSAKEYSYHVVAGAFKNEQNAEKELQNLIKKGFPARKSISKRNGLYPVFYGSYSSQSEAEKALSTIKNTENKEAWILHQTL